MQTEATFLPRALSGNKTMCFIIPPATDVSESQDVKARSSLPGAMHNSLIFLVREPRSGKKAQVQG